MNTAFGGLPDTKALADFITDHYPAQIEHIQSAIRGNKPMSLFVNMLDVFNEFPNLARHLLDSSQLIALFQSALASLLVNSPNLGQITVRLHSLPLTDRLHLPAIPTVHQVNKLVQFEGVVVRTGAVRLRDRFKVFQCGACGHKQRVSLDEQQYGNIAKPSVCANTNEDGRCKSTRFEVVADGDCGVACEDVQEVKVQDMKAGKPGAIPRSVAVLLTADLVERVQAGDVVLVTGRVLTRWRPVRVNAPVFSEIVVIADSVERHNLSIVDSSFVEKSHFDAITPNLAASEEEQMARRDHIVRQFCPEIRGMFPVKLAVLLTVIGGNATSSRSHGHLLLLGDPGTGKSHVLRGASRLLKRSVTVSGPATSSAGLTVAAVKEAHWWGLEAGALVLADGGLCCIDEFDGISKHDRAALHEALEQQCVSVAKAGMVCRLPTRCSVIAAANCVNPDSNTADTALTANSVLASPLMSRFDLIFFLLDHRQDPFEDERTADHILHQLSHTTTQPSKQNQPDTLNLPRYIAHCKRLPPPPLHPAAKRALSDYYQRQRNNDLRDLARTTIRLLESLVRLAEAHCRLCGGAIVCERDARVAMALMDLNFTSRSGEHHRLLFGDCL